MTKSQELTKQISPRITESEIMAFLDFQLDKKPYELFRYVEFQATSYECKKQGNTIIYKVLDKDDKEVTIITSQSGKKQAITLKIRRDGNDINFITNTLDGNISSYRIMHFEDDNTKITNLSYKKSRNPADKPQLQAKKVLLLNKNGIPLQVIETTGKPTKTAYKNR